MKAVHKWTSQQKPGHKSTKHVACPRGSSFPHRGQQRQKARKKPKKGAKAMGSRSQPYYVLKPVGELMNWLIVIKLEQTSRLVHAFSALISSASNWAAVFLHKTIGGTVVWFLQNTTLLHSNQMVLMTSETNMINFGQRRSLLTAKLIISFNVKQWEKPRIKIPSDNTNPMPSKSDSRAHEKQVSLVDSSTTW